MFQKWIQRDISGPMGTRSSTVTQASHAQLGGNGNRKCPSRHTLWEVSHQMKYGSQVNYRSGQM